MLLAVTNMAHIIIANVLIVLSLGYFIPLIVFAVGHFRVMRKSKPSREGEGRGEALAASSVSIVIAARNEEDGIFDCLESVLNQTLQAEVIVVDDGSTDKTAEIIAEFGPTITLIRATGGTGKRSALELGIEAAQGDIVLLTDADSVVPPRWVESMLAYFDEKTGFVAGPVQFEGGRGVFDRMVALEWAGLMGICVGAIGAGRPINCSGANIAYRKEAYRSVSGFEAMGGLTSGDDELLMQRIAEETDWEIQFAASRDAIVTSQAPQTVSEFLAQRKRWASKGGYYSRAWHVIMNIAIWFFYAALPISMVVAFWNPDLWAPVLLVLGVKMVIELSILLQSTLFYGNVRLLRTYFWALPFQVGYVVWAGAAGLFGNYEWKSRKVKR